MPVGLFGDVERRRHLACLTGWYEAARQSDLLGAERFLVHRFGRAREDERVEQLEARSHSTSLCPMVRMGLGSSASSCSAAPRWSHMTCQVR